jgi:hypothetical protein
MTPALVEQPGAVAPKGGTFRCRPTLARPASARTKPVQRAVLSLVLEAHPKSLTIPDFAREIDRGDAVERACRDLVGAGLLKCSGLSVTPTEAVLRFDGLELP